MASKKKKKKKNENRLTKKDFMPKINFEYGFRIGK